MRQRRATRTEVPVGIHTHNDCELGVANALSAVHSGASQVQGTINGFGERCGNCNLVSVIANLQVKLGIKCVPEENVQGLTHLSHFVSEVANQVPDDRQPFVGRSVFAHKGGMHVDAVQKAGGRAYEHIEPASVGNERRILVSELSGTSNVREVAQGMGIELEKGSEEARRVLAEVKNWKAKASSLKALKPRSICWYSAHWASRSNCSSCWVRASSTNCVRQTVIQRSGSLRPRLKFR
jgi:2-isopropylmalate synthase